MNKLALSVIALAGLALLASCKKDNGTTKYATFKASIEQQSQNGKTAIDTTGTLGRIIWLADDAILIDNGLEPKTFTLQSGVGETQGTFKTNGEFNLTGNYTAAYPASASIDGTTVTFRLPNTQIMANGESGTFANGANPMVAVANGSTNLAFKNPCGGLGIRMKGATEGITVSNIRIISNPDDVLWGDLTVTMNGDGTVATTAITNTATSKNIIDLTCNVTLSVTEVTRFFILLPEGALPQGFTLEVTFGDNETFFKETGMTNIAQVERNMLKSLNPIAIGPVAPVITLPAVTTSERVQNITVNSATCGGMITDYGNAFEITYGISYSEIEGFAGSTGTHVEGVNLDNDAFVVNLTGLVGGHEYFFRAYAENSAGRTYGDEVSFTTLYPSWTNGILPGRFSVSSSKQVQFSQGNLQYIGSASTPYWRFAEHQWDCIGTAQNGEGQNIDRDLFGWGTSGWNNGNTYYYPWNTSFNAEGRYRGFGYGPYDGTGQLYDLTDNYANSDWGVYNRISNGGNQARQWRTLTKEEWVYVFDTRRTVSGIRYAKAQVNNVNGVILLPDNWSTTTYNLSNTNSSNAGFSSNIIAASQWSVLEQAGAVFLPAAGYRVPNSSVQQFTPYVISLGSYGYYWSVTSFLNMINKALYRDAISVSFNESTLNPENIYRPYMGYSVRLVHQ